MIAVTNAVDIIGTAAGAAARMTFLPVPRRMPRAEHRAHDRYPAVSHASRRNWR